MKSENLGRTARILFCFQVAVVVMLTIVSFPIKSHSQTVLSIYNNTEYDFLLDIKRPGRDYAGIDESDEQFQAFLELLGSPINYLEVLEEALEEAGLPAEPVHLGIGAYLLPNSLYSCISFEYDLLLEIGDFQTLVQPGKSYRITVHNDELQVSELHKVEPLAKL